MTQLLPALVGAIAVVVVPAVAWFSQRLTQEGRLLLRINRFGAAYVLMPESVEKAAFEVHIREATRALNSWLDPDNRVARVVQRSIILALFAVAVVSLSVAVDALQIHDPFVTLTLGLAAGAVVAGVGYPLGWIAGRAVRRRRAVNSG